MKSEYEGEKKGGEVVRKRRNGNIWMQQGAERKQIAGWLFFSVFVPKKIGKGKKRTGRETVEDEHRGSAREEKNPQQDAASTWPEDEFIFLSNISGVRRDDLIPSDHPPGNIVLHLTECRRAEPLRFCDRIQPVAVIQPRFTPSKRGQNAVKQLCLQFMLL